MDFFRWGVLLVLATGLPSYGQDHDSTKPQNHAEAKANPNDCTQFWRDADWKLVPFPDTNAQYLSYQFKIPKGRKLALKFEGEYPKGVYASFVRYNELENSQSWLLDSEFTPNPGSKNPFSPTKQLYAGPQSYTAWAYSESLPQAGSPGSFTLPYSNEKDSEVDIWFRLYDETKNETIPRPKMTAYFYDGKSLQPAAECPPLNEKEYSIATVPAVELGGAVFGFKSDARKPAPEVEAKAPMPPENGEIHFYWPESGSLGDNPHVRYAATRLPVVKPRNPIARRMAENKGIIQDIGDVSVVKFKLPSSPDPKTAPDSVVGKYDMRYWSLCLSDADTRTFDCVSKHNAKIMKDKKTGERYVVVVVAPIKHGDDAETDPILKAAEARGFNVLDRSRTIVPILFLRQMLAQKDFEGNINRVKRLPMDIVREGGDSSDYYAEKYIGKYAPVGRTCRQEEFLNNQYKMDEMLKDLVPEE